MTPDPIHVCLDGEASPGSLSPEARARFAHMEATLDTVVREIQCAPVPDLVPAIMQRLPARRTATGPAWQRALAWLWMPRPVQLRPAYALAGAMACILAVMLVPLPRAHDPVPQPMLAAESSPPAMYVQFRLEAPEASQVALAGSFTDWQPRYVLHETAPGIWVVLVPLQPGVHDYAFIVDGERWTPDPSAPQVDDQFGGTNSRLSLAPPNPAV
jgi:hypothetical protein